MDYDPPILGYRLRGVIAYRGGGAIDEERTRIHRDGAVFQRNVARPDLAHLALADHETHAPQLREFGSRDGGVVIHRRRAARIDTQHLAQCLEP